MSLRSFAAIAVFCGSNAGVLDDFAEGARELGRSLARQRITTVYGGTTKGLMGVVADASLAAGGKVHGVVTRSLHERGQSHGGLSLHEITPTLRRRKERMVELANGFIALPGGIGTLEELMEVWSMNQLAEIDKPIGLLNTAGFFNPFLAFIDHMVATGFLPEAHRHSILVDADPATLIHRLRGFTRLEVPKWL